MNKRPILIIDGQNAAYAAAYSHKNLKSRSGEDSSVVYGMLTILNSYVERFKPRKVYIVWDGKKSPIRLSILPGYKGSRTTKVDFDRESFIHQVKEIRRFIRYLGIPQLHDLHSEADDIIAELSILLGDKYPKNPKIIISTDKDFLQLMTQKKVYIWNNRHKALVTPLNITKKGYFPVEPHKVVDYLCLLGDSSDNIPGYRGIGEKKAVTFLDKFTSISNFLSNPNNVFPGINHETLSELHKKNVLLIDLFEMIHEKYSDGSNGDFSMDNMPFFRGLRNPAPNKVKAKRFLGKYSISQFKMEAFLKTLHRK